MWRSLPGTPLLRSTASGVLGALLFVTLGVAAPRPVAHAVPDPMPNSSGVLPTTLAPHVNAAFAGDDPAYALTRTTGEGSALRGANPAQRFTTTFAPAGVTITERGTRAVGLALAAIGDAAPRPIAPVTRGQRVEYRRGNVTEWYINGPLGLEQGFTLAAQPAGQRTGILVLAVDVTGATVREDGADGLLLTTTDGGRLRYGALTATDATGRSLPARLVADRRAIQIIVQDAGALYPLVIDPLVQQARLTSDDGAANDAFGVAVSVSRDGGTALIGASNKAFGVDNSQGAAYVFTRVGASWSQQARLTASDGAANDRFGVSVALSGDGNIALVGAFQKVIGAPVTGSYQGAAYIFTRVGAGWGQTQELAAGDGARSDHFGNAVAVSEDGGTALVGADEKIIGGNVFYGAAYVFTRSGASWSQQQELMAGDGARNDKFGSSLAVNATGTIAIVGASGKTIGANDNQGAAYVFTRSGASWSQQQRLTAGDGAVNDTFGGSVALSGDGSTALISAPNKMIGANNYQGAVYVFTRPGASWGLQQELTAGDGATFDGFGISVTLSGDGSSALIGAYTKTFGANSYQGAAYLFTRAGTSWSQQQRLTAGDGAASDFFGVSVALSGDGSTALVGASGKTIGVNGSQGVAYVYLSAVPISLPPPQPTAPVQSAPPPLPVTRPTGVPQGTPPAPLPPPRP